MHSSRADTSNTRQFFNNTLAESIGIATANTVLMATAEIRLRLESQLFVRQNIEWKVRTEGRRISHDVGAFTDVMVSLMQSSDELVTIYQGDVGTSDVLKFSKSNETQYFVELRDHGLQQRFRKTYTFHDDTDGQRHVNSVVNDVVNKSYDVYGKSWFQAGIEDEALLVQGPSFESYVVRDLGNPTSFSIVFNMDQPDGGRSVYRLKFFTDKLADALRAIPVGTSGRLYLVKADGTVIVGPTREETVGLDEDGVAVFKDIRDSNYATILSTLTEEDLGASSADKVHLVFNDEDPDVAVAITRIPGLNDAFENELRVVVITSRDDFAAESIWFFHVSRVLSVSSIILAVLRGFLVAKETHKGVQGLREKQKKYAFAK